MKLYKYLRQDYAEEMVNRGTIQMGTLSYYRDIEDAARADRNEGKLEKSTEFKEGKTIADATEFYKELPFLKGSNISYEKGTVKILPGTVFKGNEDIPDAYIFCTSGTLSEQLKKKFGADVCVEIFNVQLFLDILSDELVIQDKTYPYTASGRKIEYTGHLHGHDVNLSGNWLKDSIYKDEDEFRFSFIPIYKKNGKRIEPIRDNKLNSTFPTDHDPIKIEPFFVTRIELTKCCRII